MTGTIYYFASKATGRVYVGSTVRKPNQRRLEHLHALRHGKHVTSHLQRVYNKHGEADLTFYVAEQVEGDVLAAEQRHIDAIGRPWIMNGAPVSDSILAAHAANRGRVMPPEERARRSASRLASIAAGRANLRTWDEAARMAHSVALTGRKLVVSDETRAKWSEAQQKRRARERAERNV